MLVKTINLILISIISWNEIRTQKNRNNFLRQFSKFFFLHEGNKILATEVGDTVQHISGWIPAENRSLWPPLSYRWKILEGAKPILNWPEEGLGTDLCGNRRPLPPRNPDRLAAIGTRNLTEPLVSMDRYFVSNRTWNITTLGLLYRGRVGLSAVWVLTGATYVQRLEKFLIGLWSKKKRKKSFQRGFKQFYPKRVHARK